MVQVSWSKSENTLEKIEPADGPGQHTDDVAVSDIEAALSEIEYIDEEIVAGAVASRYSGKFSSSECRVTADSYDDGEDTVTTIAFVELDNPQDRQETLSCESCDIDTNPEIQMREENEWLYEDLICPNCGSVLHTDLIRKPAEKNGMNVKS